MPDTYISQFSGEEIDAALRAAQIISGASTPAELRKKLEIRGDTIPVSAEDSTLISGALKYRTNPNLLDNWYFGNPVNQRSGYYIPAGVKYNTLSWTEAGTTDKAYPVIGYSGQDPLITVNGTNYIVGKSAQVPGYCTVGYCIDRWVLAGDTATLNGDGITFVSPSPGRVVRQPIEFPDFLSGKTVTFSIYAKVTSGKWLLTDTENFASVHRDVPISTGITSWTFEVADANKFGSSAKSVGFWGGTEGGQIAVFAAKLELGDTQTLAHQDSSGNWILNEIPDFGEQLRRCQRYHREIERSNYGTFAFGMSTSATEIDFLIPLNPPMRVAPSVSFEGSFATNGVSFNSISSLVVVKSYPDGITLRATGSGFVRGEERTLQVSSAATSKIIISADL